MHCAGEYETALADADAAIEAMNGTLRTDDKILVKAHYRRVCAQPAFACQ